MKKRIISVLLSAVLAASAFTLPSNAADRGIFNLQNHGDYQIFYTSRTGHAAMRVGTVWQYSDCGVLDKDGKLLVEPIYDRINPQKEGRAVYRRYEDVSLAGKYGYFDENWKPLSSEYDEACDFSEGVAVVGMNVGAPSPIATTMRYGVIDKAGNMIIPTDYHHIDDAKDGKIKVYLEEQTYPMTESKSRIGYFSTDGTLLEEPIFRHENKQHEVITYVNSVAFGDIKVVNTELQYPIVSINSVDRYGCFLPLTYDNCKLLGLGISWTPEDGLAIWSGASEPCEGGFGKSIMPESGKATMSLYEGEITINGKKYTNKDASIPMLYYNDIVYFPLYWSHAMYELGMSYRYDLEDGMIITVGNGK